MYKKVQKLFWKSTDGAGHVMGPKLICLQPSITLLTSAYNHTRGLSEPADPFNLPYN